MEYLLDLENRLKAALRKNVRILSGKKVQDISQISKSYSSACILKSQEVFHEVRPVVVYEREMSINPSKAMLFKKSLDDLVKAIEQSDDDEIKKCIDVFYDNISKAGLGDSVSLNMNYLLFQLIHIATELDDELDQEEILHRISESSFDEGIKRGSSKHMYKFATEYAQYLNQLRKNVSGGILKDVENEIKEKYNENLSLKKLSEKYFINCSYLGSLFSKKYGVSFKDYLTDYRINEAAKSAKKLLSVEMSMGQMVDDIRLAINCSKPVHFYGRTGGVIPTPVEVLEEMQKYASEGPHLFPDDMITDQPERQICAELVREKILRSLDKEVPHGTAVEITKFSERENGIVDVEATIYCEKASHKGILIGKSGSMLRKIGAEAREDMEALLGTKVFLQTWVKVKENWRDSMASLRNFGFTEQ